MRHDPQKSPSPTRSILRLIAVVIIVSAVAFWISTGSHTGFSKNRVEVPMLDPITQIEYIEYEDKFIMGVEYLAAAIGIGIATFAISFVFGRKPS